MARSRLFNSRSTASRRNPARFIEMVKATKSGAYVQRGKNWDCIDGCGIKVYG